MRPTTITLMSITLRGHFMIPFGLAKVEAALSDKWKAGDAFLRLGRKYIVNTRRVFHVNAVKAVAVLVDDHGTNYTLHLPQTGASHAYGEHQWKVGYHGDATLNACAIPACGMHLCDPPIGTMPGTHNSWFLLS